MSKKMDEAKTALAELLENAKIGNIIPIRLPRQIEEIQELLQEAEKEHTEELEQLRNVPGGDAGQIILETAEFIKTAVHDLKNPLASIKGYGDMLDVMRSNTKRMEALLSDVSTINKIRAGLLRPNNKMDMFKNIAMNLEKQTGKLAQELNRQLEFEIPQGLPLLNTDGERMAEALVKLIENGLKYSAEGEGKVTIRAKAENNTLIIEIEDNGCGMKPEELAQLGTMFFRADNEAVRAHKGSGLGIPIAYQVIEILSGTIAVESELGKGTKFTVTFEGMS
jgi:two-component system phosphate regulon sensor histidine kinase PhoR